MVGFLVSSGKDGRSEKSMDLDLLTSFIFEYLLIFLLCLCFGWEMGLLEWRG